MRILQKSTSVFTACLVESSECISDLWGTAPKKQLPKYWKFQMVSVQPPRQKTSSRHHRLSAVPTQVFHKTATCFAVILCILLQCISFSAAQSLAGDKAALLTIKAAVADEGGLLSSWTEDTDPCVDDWAGIKCNCFPFFEDTTQAVRSEVWWWPIRLCSVHICAFWISIYRCIVAKPFLNTNVMSVYWVQVCDPLLTTSGARVLQLNLGDIRITNVCTSLSTTTKNHLTSPQPESLISLFFLYFTLPKQAPKIQYIHNTFHNTFPNCSGTVSQDLYHQL